MNGARQVLSFVPKEDAVPRGSPVTIDIADCSSEVIREEAPRAPVIDVRENGRLLGGLLSSTELEHYRNLVRRDVEVPRRRIFR